MINFAFSFISGIAAFNFFSFFPVSHVKLLDTAVPTANMSDHERNQWLSEELATLNVLHTEFDKVAIERAQELVDAHERFRKVFAGSRYKVVEPILPMDLMGVYILLPDRTSTL